MPLPVNVQTGVVVGKYISTKGGTPITGTVSFTPSFTKALDGTATPPVTLLPEKETAILDANGAFTITLVATDDADLGLGAWTYKVDFAFGTFTVPSFSVAVPQGTTVDLTTVAPAGQAGGALLVQGVPVGGTAGQVLAKVTGANYDTAWVDPAATGGGATTLDGLTDVSTAGAVAGQVLEFDGTSWAPGTDGGSSAWADITGKPTTFAPIIGTTADTAKAGNYTPTKAEVGLDLVDNTADAAKPISTATQAALDLKVSTSVPLARYVLVTTGSEARPAGTFCIWYDKRVDPSTPPTNIGADDLWVTGGTSGGSTDTTPPSVPTGLASSSISSTSFTVSWTASTDDVGVTGYRVYVDGVAYATPTGTSQVVAGRTASTTYAVTVQARDAAGNWSASSTALNVTTTSTPAETYSIFPGSPSPSSTEFTDGSNTQWLADGFYRTGASLTVTGVRFWVPTAASAILSETSIAFRVYTADWNGSATLPTGAAVATATYSGPLAAGTWVEATLSAPVTVGAVNSATSGADALWVAYQIGNGTNYASAAGVGSVGGPNNTYMAETGFYGHIFSTNGGSSWSSGSGWFSTDIKATL